MTNDRRQNAEEDQRHYQPVKVRTHAMNPEKKTVDFSPLVHVVYHAISDVILVIVGIAAIYAGARLHKRMLWLVPVGAAAVTFGIYSLINSAHPA
jgi:protein-S-isoprenylcysteine O-methyltransferase Ste14